LRASRRNLAKVSIITPAYNSERLIADALDSIAAQNYDGLEVIVVDDCSNDATVDVVRQRSSADNRIRLIRQPVNAGPSRARQAALDHATGRYIAFLDSDDFWLPQKLSHQLAFMADRRAALSYTEYRRVSADGARVGKQVRVPAHLDYAALLCNTAIATSTVIVDREKTGPFAMTHTYYDDYALWLSLLRRGHRAYGLKEDLMRYRISRNSWSRNKANSARWVWRTYRDVERLSFARSLWCFGNYACRGALKYRRF
jgi:teichuronic acid biosynthesis glycosyltransferase TuaG